MTKMMTETGIEIEVSRSQGTRGILYLTIDGECNALTAADAAVLAAALTEVAAKSKTPIPSPGSLKCDGCGRESEELTQKADYPGVMRDGHYCAPMLCDACLDPEVR